MSEKETRLPPRYYRDRHYGNMARVEHPHNEKELWKMKHATPARIGIGQCGARYTTEAQLRFLAFMWRQTTQCSMKCTEEVVRSLAFLRCDKMRQ